MDEKTKQMMADVSEQVEHDYLYRDAVQAEMTVEEWCDANECDIIHYIQTAWEGTSDDDAADLCRAASEYVSEELCDFIERKEYPIEEVAAAMRKVVEHLEAHEAEGPDLIAEAEWDYGQPAAK